MKYVDVVIDTKSDNVDNFFTYSCDDDGIGVGCRVVAPFVGSGKRTGYVFAVHDEPPAGLEGKRIRSIIETDPARSISEDSVRVAEWMKRRYFCRYIDAVNCFVPVGSASKRGAKRIPAWDDATPASSAPPELTEEQSSALARILPRVEERRYGVFLLHGVTGSGKTELYMRVASAVIERGGKVVMLVPEISLTPQVIGRFVGRFGRERVAILHSKLSAGERFDEWTRIRNGETDIVIGARSAVFAPFEDIGAIIVDEEHETTYKSDMTPKYDTVEVAIKRASRARGVVVLGSATPSIVSMRRAESGLYHLLTMKRRFNATPLPKSIVVDMRREIERGNRSVFSAELHARIERALTAGKQVILFLNRRGYSPFICCRKCGYVMRCDECGIAMTYHKREERAICHFCGKSLTVPQVCPECGSGYLRGFGAGTEKVEELTRDAFPRASVARLDLDTSSVKGSIRKILRDFEKGRTDILIGTQMVAKGLDFANVSLVGIIAADVGLNIPDFRSSERTFQLITQVAGRAGRGAEVGDVVVQTYAPDNYAIMAAVTHNYRKFYDTELMLRRYMKYPPFSDVIQATALSGDERDAAEGAEALKRGILAAMGDGEGRYIFGPHKAAISKVGDDYRYQMYIKALPERRIRYENLLAELKKKMNTDRTRKCRIIIDVNPFSLM
ncbi:MAG: primosomal protein N' [Clostridiales Family XIII bacterium]|jgi:primosomal protein N' (replication factor Y)|nr:primosomal protein N' [Clostridiales Family XIII bacterium]